MEHNFLHNHQMAHWKCMDIVNITTLHLLLILLLVLKVAEGAEEL